MENFWKISLPSFKTLKKNFFGLGLWFFLSPFRGPRGVLGLFFPKHYRLSCLVGGKGVFWVWGGYKKSQGGKKEKSVDGHLWKKKGYKNWALVEIFRVPRAGSWHWGVDPLLSPGGVSPRGGGLVNPLSMGGVGWGKKSPFFFPYPGWGMGPRVCVRKMCLVG